MPESALHGLGVPAWPQSISMLLALVAPSVLLTALTCETDAMLASASPRKPSVDMPYRSVLVLTLLVV